MIVATAAGRYGQPKYSSKLQADPQTRQHQHTQKQKIKRHQEECLTGFYRSSGKMELCRSHMNVMPCWQACTRFDSLRAPLAQAALSLPASSGVPARTLRPVYSVVPAGRCSKRRASLAAAASAAPAAQHFRAQCHPGAALLPLALMLMIVPALPHISPATHALLAPVDSNAAAVCTAMCGTAS